MGTAGPQTGRFCRCCDGEKCIQSLLRLGYSVIPFAWVVEGPQGKRESSSSRPRDLHGKGREVTGRARAGSGSRSAGCHWVPGSSTAALQSACSLSGARPGGQSAGLEVLGVWRLSSTPGPPADALVPTAPRVPWDGGFAAATERGRLPPAQPADAGPVCKHSPPAAAFSPAATGLFLWVLLLIQEAAGAPESPQGTPLSCPIPHGHGQPTCAHLVDKNTVLCRAWPLTFCLSQRPLQGTF